MKRGECIHYTGLPLVGGEATCCRAGVNYHQAFDGTRPGILLRLPCETEATVKAVIAGKPYQYQQARERHGERAMPCRYFQLATAEQIAQAEAEQAAETARMLDSLSTPLPMEQS